MKRLLPLLMLGLIAPAYAQSPPNPAAYTGTELIRLETNAGSFGRVTMNHVRNTSAYLIVPAGGTVNSAPSWYQASVIATGAITTWNVNLPNPAPDGMIFSVVNSTAAALTAVSVASVTGTQTQTQATPYAAQTLAAGSRTVWQFVAGAAVVGVPSSTGTWYRIQ